MLEAAEEDITFADAKFAVRGTDRAVGLKEVARTAFVPAGLPKGLEPGLYETGTFSPPADTWPTAATSARWRSTRPPALSAWRATW